MKARISLAQIEIITGQPRANLDQGLRLIAQAAAEQSRLILFPEMWTAGYDLANCESLAEANQIAIAQLTRAAQHHRIAIAGSYLLREGEQFFNTFVLMDPDQPRPALYSKIHLFRLMHEERWLSPGSGLTLCSTFAGLTGLAVCYDLRFPEMFRSYALSGARMVLISAEWPSRRIAHWSTLLRARAIENQMVMVGVNSVGQVGEDTFGGRSAVIDPWGGTAAELSAENAELRTVDIDLALVEQAREKIPVFQDRRPDLYGG